MNANVNPVAVTTREAILTAANALVLSQGYSATSLDQILAKAGVTKGAFFYYFKSKGELAEALIERYRRSETELLADIFGRAEKLSRDPLQQVLIMVGLFEEMFEGLVDPPACLLASYIYQSELHTEKILVELQGNVLDWRSAIVGKLREAAVLYPPKGEVDFDAVADMALGIIEGAFVLGMTFRDSKLVARQLHQYRNYLELLFAAK